MRSFIWLVLVLFVVMVLPAKASTDRYLAGQFITNGSYTLTVPAITDTLLTLTGSGTLTNKSMAGNANTFSLIPVGAIGDGSVLSGSNSGDVSIGTGNGLSLLGQALSLATASVSAPGALSAADWATFNGKQDALGFTAVPDTRTVNGHALSSNVTVTASDVGLGNVTNDAQVKKSEYTAKASVLVGTGAGAYTDSLTGSGNNGYIFTLDSSETSGVKWAALPAVAPQIVGTRASPTLIVAVTGIGFSGSYYANINFIAGTAGPVVVSANPQITAASNVGQKLVLIGRDATNTVTLADGTGLSLNGTWVGGLDSMLTLVWDGSVWVEESRR